MKVDIKVSVIRVWKQEIRWVCVDQFSYAILIKMISFFYLRRVKNTCRNIFLNVSATWISKYLQNINQTYIFDYGVPSRKLYFLRANWVEPVSNTLPIYLPNFQYLRYPLARSIVLWSGQLKILRLLISLLTCGQMWPITDAN